MSWPNYLCLGGVEIVNMSRTSQLIAAGFGPPGITCGGDCAPCPDLDKGLGVTGGYNPVDSPWFDSAEPDSADFAGLLVTSVTGLGPGAFSRSVTPNANIGATLGQGVQAAPLIVVTGLLMAATCCGMDFGLRWLRSALKGGCTQKSLCAGDDLTFLNCAVDFSDEDCGPVDFVAELAPYYRTFKNAALVSGPTITQTIPRGCPDCYECGITEVSFTLAAADPCVYREPVTIVSSEMFTEVTSTDCVVWVDNTTGDAECSDCPGDADCATDPNCQDVSPPAMPTLTSACVDDCILTSVYRACFDIPASIFPTTTEGTLILSIYTGDAPMRGIEIKVWENPLGLPVDELLDCNVCGQFSVSYVAAASTLTVDGAARTAMIACPGGATVRANPFITSGNGQAGFTYPQLAGCTELYSVCISAHPEVSPLASVTAQAVIREC